MTPRRFAVALCCVGAAVVVALAILYAALQNQGEPEPEPEIIQTPKAQPPAPEPEPQTPVPEPEPQAPVPAPLEEVKPSVDPIESANAPDAPLDPDATAWDKVEHIRNNLNLYGTFHPDADAIIAQLMPPPDGFLNAKSGFTECGEFIHDEEASERVIALFDQLIALNDPRTAELIVQYEFEYGGGVSGGRRALVNLGAPSIPFLLEHADDEVIGFSVAVQLKRIVNRHPDLDPDIVTDILEPLFEKHKDWIQTKEERGQL